MNKKRNILITGAAGFVGSEMVKILLKKQSFGVVVGVDIRESHPAQIQEGFVYYKQDVRDESLGEVLKKHGVDVIVHLATIVSPTKDMSREFLYSVDVLGTKNVLDQALAAGVENVVVTSSGASYGYHPDNPEWIVETDELRGNKEFAYSDHKRIVEEMLAKYRKEYPRLKQLIFRPGTVLGETVSNQITDLFEKNFVFGINGYPTPFVFIWDRDLIEAMIKGILENKEGIYNVAGDGALTLKELAKIMKKPYIPLPYSLVYGALKSLKALKLTQYGPEQINFLRYRPVLLNTALKEQLGYTPGKTTKESFLCYLKAKNTSL